MKNEFIAYDKKNKCFIDSDVVAVNGKGEIFIFDSVSDVDGYITEVFDIEILDYSGKKDRNGAKLYKGDIVKVELPMCEDPYDKNEDLKPKTVIGVVVIRPSEGAKLLVKKIIPKGTRGIAIGRTLRIDQSQDIRIGHIYTSPEVLEEREGKK